jgi:hypothetical protein
MLCVCVCVCVRARARTNIPSECSYHMTNLHTLICMLCCEGHLYLSFFIVIQLVIKRMAGIASEVGVTVAHSVIQWSNVMHGGGFEKCAAKGTA